jgi:hypothetical protein
VNHRLIAQSLVALTLALVVWVTSPQGSSALVGVGTCKDLCVDEFDACMLGVDACAEGCASHPDPYDCHWGCAIQEMTCKAEKSNCMINCDPPT